MDVFGQYDNRVDRKGVASLNFTERGTKQFDIIHEKALATISKIDSEKE